MSLRITNNPIADAEEWGNREDPRPLLGHCNICDCEIHGSGNGWDPDDAYVIEGDYVCDDCLREYMKEWRIK